MTYTVLLSEIQHGYAEFETEEEALRFVDGTETDYDLVNWVDGETLEISIEYPENN